MRFFIHQSVLHFKPTFSDLYFEVIIFLWPIQNFFFRKCIWYIYLNSYYIKKATISNLCQILFIQTSHKLTTTGNAAFTTSAKFYTYELVNLSESMFPRISLWSDGNPKQACARSFIKLECNKFLQNTN